MQSEQAFAEPDPRRHALRRRSVSLARGNTTTIGAYAVAVLLFGVITGFVPGFASVPHVRFLLLSASFVGIVALGQTFVILGGGFDLSVPWTLNAVASAMTALSGGHNDRLIWVLPVVLAIAAGIGLANGIGVALLQISPIIMTLAANVIIEGFVLLWANGLTSTSAPPFVAHLVNHVAGPLPIGVYLWAILIGLATVILTFTGYGRRLYAVGTNPEASLLAGVNVASTRIMTYVISALCAGIAGVMLTGFIGESFLGFGDPYLFASVAAVAVGGASLLGGQGHYLGTVAGALILTFLTGLLPILNLAQGWLQIIYGFSILVTVALANLNRPGQQ